MKKRVKIPINKPKHLLDLAKKVQLKHLEDGDASVLNVLNWHEAGPTLDQALDAHEKAERYKRLMLKAYQQRDLRVDAVMSIVRNSRDILSGIYSTEMKTLGEWGYEVLDNRRKKQEIQS